MSAKPTLMQKLRSSAAAFTKGEDGLMTIYGTGIFIMMMLAGGVALDFMRFEAERSKLQYTLDRAVLAAAALGQQRDRQEVIEDYFRAAGLQGYEIQIDAIEDVNFRDIKAETSAPVRSLFLNMLGVDSIVAPASAGAQERIQDLEISLVVDVSGSMGGEKIARLKEAAGGFIDDMLEVDASGVAQRGDEVSISVVPYNGKVNSGDLVAQYFDHGDEHDESACARFEPSDFTSASMTFPLERLGHFARTEYNDPSPTGGIRWWTTHCYSDRWSNRSRILPWSNDPDALKSHINGLNAGGWTAVDVGMKWGTALLDPSTRSQLNAMVSDNFVDDEFRGRPVDHGTANVLKIAVVMTDGANTDQYDLRADRRGSALSPIYAYNDSFLGGSGNRTQAAINTILADRSDTRYSVYFSEMDRFFEWKRNDLRNTPVGEADAVRLSWDEVHRIFEARYLQKNITNYRGTRRWIDEAGNPRSVWVNYRQAENQTIPQEDWNYWASGVVELRAGNNTGIGPHNNVADSNLSNICRSARDEGILVYTIAFQAGAGGERAMRDCAFEPAFYIDVDDDNLQGAFEAIASSIQSLKLTQ